MAERSREAGVMVRPQGVGKGGRESREWGRTLGNRSTGSWENDGGRRHREWDGEQKECVEDGELKTQGVGRKWGMKAQGMGEKTGSVGGDRE